MIESTCNIRVRYAETDKMGVVYHGNYLVWFETARVQMLDELGLPYIDMERDGYMLPVIECSAKFMRPARFDDRVQIHSQIKERPSLRIKVDYRVTCGEELLATGFTQHVFVDPQGRPVKPPQAFIDGCRERFNPKS